MSEDTYNGWRNYATWRVNLEIASDMLADTRERVTAEWVKDQVEELLFLDTPDDTLVASYALSFLSDVDWHEIAEAHNADLSPDEDDDEDDEA